MTEGSRKVPIDPRADRDLQTARARLLSEYAPGTQSHSIRWSGGATQVLELGRGPPLVLVHGGAGQASDWASIMPSLADRFHLYAVDRPGHGLADAFDYRGVDVSAHGVTFVGGILDALGLDSVPLVGHSMGGRWTLDYALRHPDRVSRLVLVGDIAGSRLELPPELYKMGKFLRLIRRPIIGGLVRSAMRKPSSTERSREGIAFAVAHPERIKGDLLDHGTLNFIRNSRSIAGLLDRVLDARGLRPDFLFGDRWRNLRMPTVYIWGEREVFDTVEHGQEMAKQAPEGRFVLVPDAGHIVWLDEPQLVAREIVSAVEEKPSP